MDDGPTNLPSVELSIISPVYGCAGCLESLYRRVAETLRSLGVSYELILVDDRGPDDAWTAITSLGRVDPEHVRGLRLSRNYGQHAAITAGLAVCRGRAAVVMDCDLQDPPEEIARLYAKFREGHHVVLSRRLKKKHSPFKQVTARVYGWLLDRLTARTMMPEVGGFSLISRPVIEAFKQFKDVNRHYLYILSWLGFDPVYIEYEHQERWSGKSGYTFRKLLHHAIQGLFFQSTEFLVTIVAIGIFVFLLGIAVALWVFYVAVTGNPVSGWASTTMVTSLMGGFVIFIQGVIGLYVGQIFDQVKGRPLYVVADSVGVTPTDGQLT